MAKSKPMTHHDVTTPREALTVLISWLKGEDVDWHCALKAGMFLGLYILSVTEEPETYGKASTATSKNKKAMAAKLEEAAASLDNEAAAGAFDWSSFLPMILQILQMILSRK